MLVILIAVFCAQDAWAIEKIVCFPERINVDSTIEAKLRAAISAGADGVVFDQWSKEVPFTREPHEAQLVKQQHKLLDICDSAKVKVWLVSQISSKYDYKDPCAIPLRMIGSVPLKAEFVDSSATITAANPRTLIRMRVEPSRLYEIRVNVVGKPVQMIWMRDTEVVKHQSAPVVRVELSAGEHIIECPALDDTDRWMLVFRNSTNSSVHVSSIIESAPQSSSVRNSKGGHQREGWYDYLGIPDQGFTWSRSPRFEDDSTRRAAIERNCSFLAREFGRHPSVVATLNWSDEWANGGHDRSFQTVFPSAGAGFAKEISRWSEIQYRHFKHPGLAFGDMFCREGEYSRACNPHGGGFTHAIDYLPPAAPVELIIWDNTDDPKTLLQQVKKLEGRSWAAGVNMGGHHQSRAWRQAYDRCKPSSRPERIIFFGWNHTDFTEEHLREEFAEWK